jgi:hypothetical protein
VIHIILNLIFHIKYTDHSVNRTMKTSCESLDSKTSAKISCLFISCC